MFDTHDQNGISSNGPCLSLVCDLFTCEGDFRKDYTLSSPQKLSLGQGEHSTMQIHILEMQHKIDGPVCLALSTAV